MGAGEITCSPEDLPYGPDIDGVVLQANRLQDDMKARIPEWQHEQAERERMALVASKYLPEEGYRKAGMIPFVSVTGEEKWLSKHIFVGKGAWSEVYRSRIWGESEHQVAFKELRHRTIDNLGEKEKMGQLSERMEWERNIWRSLDHPNIARFLGHATTPRPGLVSRWYPNGTIASFLNSNPLFYRLDLAIGCAKGLQYLHSKNVIHGDIRDSNILIDEEENPIIIDFGYAVHGETDSTVLTETHVPTECRYIARERLVSKTANVPLKESDIYSFGCLVLFASFTPYDHILTLCRPFHTIEDTDDVYAMLTGPDNLPRPVPGDPHDCKKLPASDPAWPLMNRCWDDVDNRPSAQSVLAELTKLDKLNSTSYGYVRPIHTW
ncbi:hypothetical protein FRC02_000538 [Tulasnella sp. 418]|nr:hypothetical protein FRC02_000538 [Tulasnella sp. 418]